MTQPTPEACQAVHEVRELHQGAVISLPGKWCWRCQCGAERTAADAVKGNDGWDQCADELHGHIDSAVLDAVWPLAEAAGYRRAVQALRDAQQFAPLARQELADYLESLAAAPRPEVADG